MSAAAAGLAAYPTSRGTLDLEIDSDPELRHLLAHDPDGFFTVYERDETLGFAAAHVRPYLVYGAVLDNQKSISVRGTFLQNQRYMDVFYHEGYTDIEMEAGPYLSAIIESLRPRRHPHNEIVNLYGASFDIGFIHYASDKPMSRGQSLGTQTLSYYGMDSTYAASVAILKRILEKEIDAV